MFLSSIHITDLKRYDTFSYSILLFGIVLSTGTNPYISGFASSPLCVYNSQVKSKPVARELARTRPAYLLNRQFPEKPL